MFDRDKELVHSLSVLHALVFVRENDQKVIPSSYQEVKCMLE